MTQFNPTQLKLALCPPAPTHLSHLPQDAMGVARNILLDPRLVPGGGAVEMAVSRALAGGWVWVAVHEGRYMLCVCPGKLWCVCGGGEGGGQGHLLLCVQLGSAL
jgi:hypothetical protein